MRLYSRDACILQSEATECGLACLAMISNIFGHQIDMVTLRARHSVSGQGATLDELKSIASTLQLSTRAVKCELSDLKFLQLPAILHWEMDHFVVITKYKRGKATILDPAVGKRTVDFETLNKCYTGVALECQKVDGFENVNERSQFGLSSLWSKVSGLISSTVFVLCLSIIIQVAVLLSPILMQTVVDEVLITHDIELLQVLVVGFFLVLLIHITAMTVRSLLTLKVSNQINYQIGSHLVQHLMFLPSTFFERRSVGDMMSRLSSLTDIRELLSKGLTDGIIDGVMSIALIILMYMYSPILTGIVLAFVLLYGAVRLIYFPTLKYQTEQLLKDIGREQTFFIENIKGIDTIKLRANELDRLSVWQNEWVNVINGEWRLGKLKVSFEACKQLIWGCENLIVIYMIAQFTIEGELSLGMVFAFMSLKLLFLQSISKFLDQWIELKMIRLHLDRLGDIVLTKQENLLLEHGQSPAIRGEIILDNVSFRYSDNTPWLLRNCSLKVNAGEVVALTGPSGSGKSTILKLLLGLYSPTEGRILIDGLDLEHINKSYYRSLTGTVLQNDALFTGTLLDNITFFSHKPCFERVRQVCMLASIDQEIESLPMGYLTPVDDTASMLSGGQKQRLIMARSLYHNPTFLFMDEATSHLDVNNEKAIGENIRCLDMTRVVIAHRKETIEQAQRVYYLESGCLKLRPTDAEISTFESVPVTCYTE